ncbi:Cystic Fibrosis Transmembrane conductance regulator homolog [Caenorhabditis elegans]|uniref:Cystic Fibrosis Transmembrane conductance regulator homolog n=1 Tax=Caenorhabditis elegans TaxID=6239 RepID=Q95QV2_CAEEL|nr:Cystic Fibrosis Transmembrane conductance regulator homolog [Caenorhabditis elegans]CCD65105.1 Cystic Fibrosis Transmembrane conductance regulator homolog [Caenorhabditis elegans]|eukprot:NP_504463.1 Cystic Fibrosis Transmembrane conductance regulator homolog [Caenorhabditis elegans]
MYYSVSVNLSKNARQIQNETENEQAKSSFASKLLELPVSKLLQKCRSSTITVDDLPILEEKQCSNRVMSGFKWKKRVIFSILMKFWKSFAGAFAFRMCAIFADYASILLLKYLIDSAEISATLFNFFIIAVLILFFMQLKSLLLGVHTYLVGEDSVEMVTVLNNIIVKKALHLTSENTDWNRSKISKLLTTHSEAVSNGLAYVHHSCSALIELTIALFWIWETLGTRTIIVVLIVALVYAVFNIIDSYVYKKSLKVQLKCRDERVEFEKTVLNSMETIKMFSWEPHFWKKLKSMRGKELSVFRKTLSINSFMHSLNVTSPFVITFVSFAVYGLQYEISALRFEDAFVLIAIFNYMRRPLHVIIPSLEIVDKALHSATIINQFLIVKQSPKINTKTAPQPPVEPDLDIKILNANFSWNGKDDTLNDVCVHVKKGEKHAFIGFPLCGKSSLLFSITGELKMTKGNMWVSKGISFAPASPYIFSQSLKENILFGNDYVKSKYDKVIMACDLKKDIFSLPRCEATVLGDKGYVLTSTQKAQISLARCLYEDADIYALDKAFGPMDRTTSNKIFTRVLGENGYLRDKTVILATNNIELIKTFTMVHVLKNGKIETSGSYDQILECSEIMSDLLNQSRIDKIIEEKYSDEKPPRKTVMFDDKVLKKRKKKQSMEDTAPVFENRSVYPFYFRSGSFIFTAFYIVLLICRFVFQALAFFWLSFWLDPVWKKVECENCPQYVFIQTMSFFAISAIISTMLSYTFFVLTNVQTSRKLYQHITSAIFAVPMIFLSPTNKESLMNMITSDLDIVDTQFPLFFKFSFECTLHILMIFAIVCVNVPVFAIFVVAFLIFLVGLLRYFLPALHKISSLEEQKRDLFLCGSIEDFEARIMVRTFGKTRQTLAKTSVNADILTRCRMARYSTLRWISLRTEFISNLMICMCFFIASICLKVDYIGNAQFALSVASILCISELVSTFIRTTCILESLTPHVQRISNVREYPKEPMIDKCTIRDSWPDDGKIEIKNLNVFANKYRHVIKDVSLVIEEREKLGIIGKVGSGKSQLAKTLVMMSSADKESHIVVDDLDIFEMSVKTLRSRITVIPQKAKIFSDTLRSNIDPCCQFADSDIWLAIEACQLREYVKSLPDGLHQMVSPEKMSNEQKCQVNVCRALLKGGQIFVIDQSTKMMKEPIKSLVNEAIRNSLKQSTTIWIGEDFSDVEHCDRVVVIENGVILTTDTPQNLISEFGSLQKCLLNFSK